MDRRTILKRLVQAAGLVAAAAVAVPSLICALSPALAGPRRGGAWSRLGRLEDFPVGEVSEAVIDLPAATGGAAAWPPPLPAKGVYVWRPAADRVVVFSRACTDLGCPVNYDTGSECYFCPCHGGIFNKDGQRMAGPPQRPLYRYDVRVRGGVVEVDAASAPAAV